MKTPSHAVAAVYFTLFVILIFGGIALKRIWGMPEFMMLFHLPAAVFLVLCGIELKKRRQRSYDAEIRAIRGSAKPMPQEESV